MNYDLEPAEVRFAARLSQGSFLPRTRRESERGSFTLALHDTSFQGFDASLALQNAPEKKPAISPSTSPLSRALQLMRRAIEEGRLTLQGLRSAETAPTSLERALADFGNEFPPGGVRFQIFVKGRPKALRPRIREQIYLIAREAVANAFHHSKATSIEVEVVYLPGTLGVIIHDNGCGIDPQAVRRERKLHRGLLGMHERARNIGAHLDIWSGRGSGTEVEISISSDLAIEIRTCPEG
jgi:signal transduction histidine kinase